MLFAVDSWEAVVVCWLAVLFVLFALLVLLVLFVLLVVTINAFIPTEFPVV